MKDPVAIIQHPGGMVKQVSLHNNLVTMAAETRLQYLTDTLKGSSGAPIFDRNWWVVELILLELPYRYRTTGGQAARNEGVPIAHVRARAMAMGADLHLP